MDIASDTPAQLLSGLQMQLADRVNNGQYLDKGFRKIPVYATIDGANGKPVATMLEAHPKIVTALQNQFFIGSAQAKPLTKSLRDPQGKA